MKNPFRTVKEFIWGKKAAPAASHYTEPQRPAVAAFDDRIEKIAEAILSGHAQLFDDRQMGIDMPVGNMVFSNGETGMTLVMKSMYNKFAAKLKAAQNFKRDHQDEVERYQAIQELMERDQYQAEIVAHLSSEKTLRRYGVPENLWPKHVMPLNRNAELIRKFEPWIEVENTYGSPDLLLQSIAEQNPQLGYTDLDNPKKPLKPYDDNKHGESPADLYKKFMAMRGNNAYVDTIQDVQKIMVTADNVTVALRQPLDPDLLISAAKIDNLRRDFPALGFLMQKLQQDPDFLSKGMVLSVDDTGIVENQNNRLKQEGAARLQRQRIRVQERDAHYKKLVEDYQRQGLAADLARQQAMGVAGEVFPDLDEPMPKIVPYECTYDRVSQNPPPPENSDPYYTEPPPSPPDPRDAGPPEDYYTPDDPDASDNPESPDGSTQNRSPSMRLRM